MSMKRSFPALASSSSSSFKQWSVARVVALLFLVSLSACTSAFSFAPRNLASDIACSRLFQFNRCAHHHRRQRIRRRRRRQNQHSLLSFPESDNENDKTKDSFYIRKALYSDLAQVANIVMASFYTKDNQKMPWSHFFRLGELNRLQLNFPYADAKHYMLVACCSSSDQVVAFCDIDARPPTPQHYAQRQPPPPRPYLSDLCIDPLWRRQGIASSLIQYCQDLVVQCLDERDMYIRVEQNNTAAVRMYTVKLDYQVQAHDYFGVKDTTILLHKTLTTTLSSSNGVNDEVNNDDKNRTDTKMDETVLDYVL